MFEDKRYNKDGLNKKRFFTSDDNNGLNDGNDNLNFNQQPTYVPEPEPIPKRPKKKTNYKVLLVILLVVAVIGLMTGTFFVVKEVLSAPDRIYTKSLEEGYQLLSGYLKEFDSKKLNYDKNVDTIYNTGTLKFETNFFGLADFSKYEYNYKFNLDLAGEQADVNLSVNDSSKSLFDIKAYLRDKKLYVSEERALEKLLEFGEFSDLDFSSIRSRNVDANDLINIIRCVKEYLSGIIDKNSIIKENATILVNGANLKVNNNIYNFSKEQVQEHMVAMVDALMKDENALESLADIYGYSKRDMNSYLRRLKNNEDFFDNFLDVQFNIYTKGFANSFVGLKIVYDDEEILNYGVIDNKSELKINLEETSINIFTDNGVSDISVLSQDEEILSVKYSKNGDNTKVDASLVMGEETSDINLDIEQKRIGDKRLTLAVVGDLLIDGKDLKFRLDNMTQVGTKIDYVGVSEAKKVADLSSSEIDRIKSNLEKMLIGTPFNGLFDGFIGDSHANNCDVAYDCECHNGVCDCKYLNEDGEEEDIVCEK